MKFYRGNAAAARAYVEVDHSRADDYYLTEGNGLATRYAADHDGVLLAGQLDGPAYERWVAGYDVETSAAKGRLRNDDARSTSILVHCCPSTRQRPTSRCLPGGSQTWSG